MAEHFGSPWAWVSDWGPDLRATVTNWFASGSETGSIHFTITLGVTDYVQQIGRNYLSNTLSFHIMLGQFLIISSLNFKIVKNMETIFFFAIFSFSLPDPNPKP